MMFWSILRIVGLILLGLGALLALAWVTSPDPKYNPASFEETPLEMRIAPVESALTLAQYLTEAGETATVLVIGFDAEQIQGVDLADIGAPRLADPFAVVAALGADQVEIAATLTDKRVAVAFTDLLPAGPTGARHIGIGTNFPEHAEESNSESVFNFPKFGTATPARTEVSAPPGSLMDYEVELCLRFDRSITSLADFDAAVKGVFLCADFTDRIALVELADPDNLDSGYGFSDAKSGPGYFPTGPFLVIPKDWRTFVGETRMTTALNGKPRQDARGHEMILDFQQLVDKTLSDMATPRFFYEDAYYHLAPNGQIAADMTLMSGTSEGVIFTPPARHDYIEFGLAYLLSGGPLSGRDLVRDVGLPRFIENELASGHFLQPGDTVTYRASTLGEIQVEIVE